MDVLMCMTIYWYYWKEIHALTRELVQSASGSLKLDIKFWPVWIMQLTKLFIFVIEMWVSSIVALNIYFSNSAEKKTNQKIRNLTFSLR